MAALLALCSTIEAKAMNFTPNFGINSESAILYNLDTEEIVYEKNPEKQQIPAQLVHIMAAVVCLEHCADIDTTLITANSELYNEFYLYGNEYGYDDLRYAQIYDDDSLSAAELIYAMMLTSSCEASVILANYFGQGIGFDFVKMMNEKAAEIGCVNTNFTNATGLYDENQYTTASDILKITRYALTVPRFEEIATAPSYTPVIRNTNNHKGNDWYWSNSNVMMNEKSDYYYEGTKGIKTGNLEQSGRNLVMKSSRNGFNYLLVLMNAPFEDGSGNLQYYHLTDAIHVMDWAYETFEFAELLSDKDELAEVPVSLSSGNSYVLAKPESSYSEIWCSEIDISVVQPKITLKENVKAPVKKGDILGFVELSYNGEKITDINLVAASDVERSFLKYNLYAASNYFHSGFFKASLITALIAFFIYIFLCVYSYVSFQSGNTPKDPVHLVPKVIKSGTSKQSARKSKKKTSGKSVYDQKEKEGYKGEPIKPVDIKYDDYDFRH